MTLKDWPAKAAQAIVDMLNDSDYGIRFGGAERFEDIIAAHAEPLVAELAELNTRVARKTGLIADLTTACQVHSAGASRYKEIVTALVALLRESKREHRMSCASVGYPEEVSGCTCGADAWNTKVDEVLR